MNIRDVSTKELEKDQTNRAFAIYAPTGRFFEGKRFGKYVVMQPALIDEFNECFYWLQKVSDELLHRKRQIIIRPNFWLTKT